MLKFSFFNCMLSGENPVLFLIFHTMMTSFSANVYDSIFLLPQYKNNTDKVAILKKIFIINPFVLCVQLRVQKIKCTNKFLTQVII